MMGAGIVPVKISADASKEAQDSVLARFRGRAKLTPVDLLLFTRQLGTMVRAGLPMMQALSGMQSSSGNPKLAAAMKTEAGRRLAEGRHLTLRIYLDALRAELAAQR